MYQLTISDDEGKRLSVLLTPPVLTIGRGDKNGLRLCERNVSRRHARLLRDGDRLLIEDLGSANGTRVNGQVLPAGQLASIGGGDRVHIGDFELLLSRLLPTPPVSPLPPVSPVQVPPPPLRERSEVTPRVARPGPGLWSRIARAIGRAIGRGLRQLLSR
ncbi:MAG: FHA domain-containing protein [Polyangia bacterium]